MKYHYQWNQQIAYNDSLRKGDCHESVHEMQNRTDIGKFLEGVDVLQSLLQRMEESQPITSYRRNAPEKNGWLASKTRKALQRMRGEFRRERVEKRVLFHEMQASWEYYKEKWMLGMARFVTSKWICLCD